MEFGTEAQKQSITVARMLYCSFFALCFQATCRFSDHTRTSKNVTTIHCSESKAWLSLRKGEWNIFNLLSYWHFFRTYLCTSKYMAWLEQSAWVQFVLNFWAIGKRVCCGIWYRSSKAIYYSCSSALLLLFCSLLPGNIWFFQSGCIHITFALRWGGGSNLFTTPHKRTRGEGV